MKLRSSGKASVRAAVGALVATGVELDVAAVVFGDGALGAGHRVGHGRFGSGHGELVGAGF